MSQAGVKQRAAAENTQARQSGRYNIDEAERMREAENERRREAENERTRGANAAERTRGANAAERTRGANAAERTRGANNDRARAVSNDQDGAKREEREPTSTTLQLLEINTLSDEELEWIETRKRSRTPSEPVRGLTSAVFAKEGEEDQSFSALRPYYREPTLERVQLQFEDRSLDPQHNPLAHSSLMPPPKRHAPAPRPVGLGVGALALLGVGYLAAAHFESNTGAGTLEPPARMAKAPHVLPIVPSSAEQTQNAATAAPALGQVSEPEAAEANTPEVPWSIDPAGPVAPSVAPNVPVVTGAVAEAEPLAGVPLPPGRNRRRLMALRARLAATRTAAAQVSDAALLAQLPPKPSREQIQVGVEGVRTALQECALGLHGTTTARITVTGQGRVAQANINGAFAGTPQGSCMARALRTAVFPRFAAPSLQVTYPFRF